MQIFFVVIEFFFELFESFQMFGSSSQFDIFYQISGFLFADDCHEIIESCYILGHNFLLIFLFLTDESGIHLGETT